LLDTGRSFQQHPTPHRVLITVLVLICAALAAGCSSRTSASFDGLIPLTGSNGTTFVVQEYPLVEQSSDNPTHPLFIEHVPETGFARRMAQPETAVQIPNTTLARFGFRLAVNPAASYRTFALYHGERLVQADILHFWPVTLNAAGDDFLLPFETLTGLRQVASSSGLKDWPGSGLQKTTPPVFIGDRLAYAAVSDSQISVQAGGQVLYTRPDPLATTMPGRLSTWDEHWALEVDGRVIIDGQDLNASLGSERIILWHILRGQPFFLFLKDGLTRISYAGQTLPYTYDAIVAGDTPETAIFSPGLSEDHVWFFALRDGLWYYVEAGPSAK
jgi:hypothetical protein